MAFGNFGDYASGFVSGFVPTFQAQQQARERQLDREIARQNTQQDRLLKGVATMGEILKLPRNVRGLFVDRFGADIQAATGVTIDPTIAETLKKLDDQQAETFGAFMRGNLDDPAKLAELFEGDYTKTLKAWGDFQAQQAERAQQEARNRAFSEDEPPVARSPAPAYTPPAAQAPSIPLSSGGGVAATAPDKATTETIEKTPPPKTRDEVELDKLQRDAKKWGRVLEVQQRGGDSKGATNARERLQDIEKSIVEKTKQVGEQAFARVFQQEKLIEQRRAAVQGLPISPREVSRNAAIAAMTQTGYKPPDFEKFLEESSEGAPLTEQAKLIQDVGNAVKMYGEDSPQVGLLKEGLRNVGKPKTTDVARFRNDFMQEVSKSGFVDAKATYDVMKELAVEQREGTPSGFRDLSMIISYARLLDPTSVVREGERDIVMKTRALPDWLVQTFQKVSGTDLILAPDQRARLMQAATDTFVGRARDYASREREFKRIAVQEGYDPTSIPDYISDPDIRGRLGTKPGAMSREGAASILKGIAGGAKSEPGGDMRFTAPPSLIDRLFR